MFTLIIVMIYTRVGNVNGCRAFSGRENRGKQYQKRRSGGGVFEGKTEQIHERGEFVRFQRQRRTPRGGRQVIRQTIDKSINIDLIGSRISVPRDGFVRSPSSFRTRFYINYTKRKMYFTILYHHKWETSITILNYLC